MISGVFLLSGVSSTADPLTMPALLISIVTTPCSSRTWKQLIFTFKLESNDLKMLDIT